MQPKGPITRQFYPPKKEGCYFYLLSYFPSSGLSAVAIYSLSLSSVASS